MNFYRALNYLFLVCLGLLAVWVTRTVIRRDRVALRLLIAFAVSPLVIFLIFLLFASVGMFAGIFSVEVLGAGVFGLVIAYPVMLVIGIPITLGIRMVGSFRPAVMAAAGAVAGGLPFSPAVIAGLRNGDLGGMGIFMAGIGMLSGLGIGYVVWRIAFVSEARPSHPSHLPKQYPSGSIDRPGQRRLRWK